MAGPRRDFLLDARGNRVLVNADYGFADDLVAVGQGVRVRVSLFLGEYWLNEALGVDYLGSILIKNPVEIVVKGLISRAIADTPDVTQVVDTGYALDGRTRTAAVSYTAASPYGVVTSGVQIP